MVQKLILPLQWRMDNISYDFIDVEIPGFRPEFFDLWLARIVKLYGKEIRELAYIFVTDAYLLNMNKEHLGHDYYTDIITFNYNEDDVLSGDIFISYERVKANATEFGNGSVEDELCRVMAHGLLHLVGYNDKSESDEREMRKQEDLCLTLR
jgi:probable rRNA maturation factor